MLRCLVTLFTLSVFCGSAFAGPKSKKIESVPIDPCSGFKLNQKVTGKGVDGSTYEGTVKGISKDSELAELLFTVSNTALCSFSDISKAKCVVEIQYDRPVEVEGTLVEKCITGYFAVRDVSMRNVNSGISRGRSESNPKVESARGQRKFLPKTQSNDFVPDAGHPQQR